MSVEVYFNGVMLTAEVIPMGENLCVAVTGRDRPHLGCAVLAVPHPGISDPAQSSATVSALNLPAHRDDRLAVPIAKTLAAALKRAVVVVCGVHFDCFSAELAIKAEQAAKKLGQEILKQWAYEKEDSRDIM